MNKEIKMETIPDVPVDKMDEQDLIETNIGGDDNARNLSSNSKDWSYPAGTILHSANFVLGSSGWQIDGKGNAEFNAGTFRGSLVAGQIHIPDIDTTANSFHTNTTGNSWWGATQTNFNANNDNANAYILSTGVAKFQSVSITGSSTITLGAGNNILKQNSTDGIWLGNAAFASAVFSVSLTGAVVATSGTVGGWSLSSTTISATNITLTNGAANTANITVGTGATAGGLNSANAGTDIAFWSGATFANRATAAFRVNAQGDLTATSATITGAITANTLTANTAGTIGGWSIAATTLSATNITLTSGAANTANITVGTGATAGGLNSANAGSDIIFWGGDTFANRATAPFRVTAAGALVATSATITGSITATSGAIGGFNIGSDYIRDAADSMGLASTVTGGDDVRFWAGTTFANRATAAFRVTEAGVVTASSGTIGGWTLSATTLTSTGVVLDAGNQKITVGSGSPNLTIDGANTRVRSSNYVSGFAGAGFTLEPNLLEVGNIACRGLLRTYVLQKDIISVNAGSLLITPNADVLDTDMTALDASTVTIKGTTTFAVGDRLRIKDGTDDEWMQVTVAAAAPTYTVDRDKAGAYAANSNPAWKKGATVANYGQPNAGGLYLTASDTNNPYLSVFTHAGSPWTTITTQLRIGNLNGYLGYVADTYGLGVGSSAGTDANITIDPTNGIRIRNGTTNVITLDNAGNVTVNTITATSGTIAAFTIAATTISATNLTITSGAANAARITVGSGSNLAGMNSANAAGDITFWSGDTHANRATAPFRVTAAGAVTATSISTVDGNDTYTFVAGEAIDASTVPKAVYLKESDGRVYKLDSTAVGEAAFAFIGFAILGENVALGANIKIQMKDVVTGFSGLTVGGYYFGTNTAGNISTTPGTVTLQVGRAITATTLLIQVGKKTFSGTYDFSSTTTTTVTTGFRPYLIKINAVLTGFTDVFSNGGWEAGVGNNTCVYNNGDASDNNQNGTKAWFLKQAGNVYHSGVIDTLANTSFRLNNTENVNGQTVYLSIIVEG